MTALLTRLRDDSLTARKARDESAAFRITLFAEATRPGKDDGNRESTDAEVLATIKKFIKNASETLKALGDKSPDSQARINAELAILGAYLPKQASGPELQAAIADIVAGLAEKSPKQVGVVMGQLQARFEGNFDKKEASELVKAAFTS